MVSETHRQVKILFFPFMAQGHVIPTVDMAKLFASRGASVSILTTPLNVAFFEKSIQRSQNSGHEIGIRVVQFPSTIECGLPENCENLDDITENVSHPPAEMIARFFSATRKLVGGLEEVLEEMKPDCLVADMFYPWATESADKFGVRRLVFHGTSCFALCVMQCLRLYEPHKKVSSDSEPFVIPHLPGNITLSRNKLPGGGSEKEGENEIARMLTEVRESETKSFGVIINSFYELESDYTDFYRKELRRRAWHVGPVSLCNREIEEKADRGKKADIDEHECLRWLDSRKTDSVIYVCFGSVARFSDSQLMEIANGLEASGQAFIWVVRKNDKGKEGWLPEGFEDRTKDRGLIIRGWAPQVLILDHQATGGFVTHCGWNSALEGISAGVPMVAWPILAEQFCNEKLLTNVLDIAVSVGVQERIDKSGVFITCDKIEKAVREITIGEEAGQRRCRAKRFAELAKRAVEEGGSSYSDMDDLIRELVSG